ncbi:tripartite tricarboxylate transporter substrate-binding protein [Hydrogenophaga sp.]|uniref:tripartite tricarboxylate transporter substrate-binding protein n=1 Tax=Hydrogenophaga sp. TaxID=1904254 RepID=UPI002FC6C314
MIDSGTSRRVFLQACAAAFATRSLAASAQVSSDASVTRFILGSPPGSALDVLCRRVADQIQPGYSRNAVVETRSGASGQIAVATVKAAEPDGMTVLATPMPHMGIFPHSYRKLPYDPVADFAPVAMGATFDLAFAVGPAVPAAVNSMATFVAWAKANPSRAHFGSPAAGSTPHFVGALAARAAGVAITHIPYRGPSPAVTDMVGGQVSAACVPIGDLLQFANAGRCRIIATTGAARNRFTPGVATFQEQGFRDLVLNDWFAFFVPQKTPKAQVLKLNTALRAALSNPEVVKALDEKGLTAAWSSPADLAARLKADLHKWGPIVKSFGFTADS